MNFLALLVGLGVERVLTHFFHLREFRWLDPLFEMVFGRIRSASRAGAVVELVLVALLLTAPVGYVSLVLAGELRQVPGFVFAVLVLLFSLGPRDLQEEVHEYCAAVEAGAADDTRRLAQELAEHEQPEDPGARARDIERAIYVQANNRIFGVVFWFLLLGPAGPAGAWLFRVTDLMRRRAVCRDPGGQVPAAARLLHGLLAWLPARLMAAAFALAGSFGGAVAGWRAPRGDPPTAPVAFFEHTEDLIDRVGHGARGPAQAPAGVDAGTAPASRSAMALVRRTLWLIWYPVIALLTLNNWVQ